VAKKGSAVAKKGSAVAKKGSTAANRLLARDYYHTYYNLTNNPVDCSRLRSFPVPGTHGLDQTGSWWSSSIADWIGPCQSVRSRLQSWTDRTEHCLALLCARSMLALTSATPGMPYAAVRALGISTPGRSLSRVIPAVRNVRGVRIEVALHTHVCSQVASRARVPASPTGCTRPKRGVRDLRRPPLERDFFFLMSSGN
jgi:hypothetical protein